MNDFLIIFRRPGTKDICTVNKRYNEWKIHFNEEEKERIKKKATWDKYTGDYYLDVNVYDAKQFCKELNAICLQDGPEFLTEKLKNKKAELEAQDRRYQEYTKSLRFEIEEIEEKLKNLERN